MPLVRRQSGALARGPVSWRNNCEPAKSSGCGRATENGVIEEDDAKAGATRGIVMSPAEDQSVVWMTILEPLRSERGSDASRSVSSFAALTETPGWRIHRFCQEYTDSDVIRP